MADFDADKLGGFRGIRRLTDEVLSAGAHAMKLLREGAADRVRIKPDQSPVTEADEAVEQRLRAYVARAFPGAAFVGEETGASPPNQGPGPANPLRFIVDPIDGTRAFVRGLPTWSILLAVELEGAVVLGVAFMPQADDLMVGIAGLGTTVNGRPARLSTTDKLDTALVAHGGLGQFADADRLDALPRLATGTHTQRGFSDFANYRELLLGRADAVVDPSLRIWDIAPAALMVREAGGRATTFDGHTSVQDGDWIASNGAIHEAVSALLKQPL